MNYCGVKTTKGKCKNKIKKYSYGCHLHRKYKLSISSTPVYDILPREMWELIYNFADVNSLSSLATTCIEIRKGIDSYLKRTPLYIMAIDDDDEPHPLQNINSNSLTDWMFVGSYRFGYDFYNITDKTCVRKNSKGLKTMDINVDMIYEELLVELQPIIYIYSSISQIDELRSTSRIFNLNTKIFSNCRKQRNIEIMEYIIGISVYIPYADR